MKKQVEQFIFSLGGSPSYSGKIKTMYITDPLKKSEKQSIEDCIYTLFGFELPFKLKTN